MARAKEIPINIDSMTVDIQIEKGKVLLVAIDGERGIATLTEAVEHGTTSLITVKGQSKKFIWNEEELI